MDNDLRQLEEEMTFEVLSTLDQYQENNAMMVTATYNFLSAITDLDTRNRAMKVYEASINNVIEALCSKYLLYSKHEKKYALISLSQKQSVIKECLEMVYYILEGSSQYNIYLHKNEFFDTNVPSKSIVGMAIELTVNQKGEDTLEVIMCFAQLDDNDNNNYQLKDLVRLDLN